MAEQNKNISLGSTAPKSALSSKVPVNSDVDTAVPSNETLLERLDVVNQGTSSGNGVAQRLQANEQQNLSSAAQSINKQIDTIDSHKNDDSKNLSANKETLYVRNISNTNQNSSTDDAVKKYEVVKKYYVVRKKDAVMKNDADKKNVTVKRYVVVTKYYAGKKSKAFMKDKDKKGEDVDDKYDGRQQSSNMGQLSSAESCTHHVNSNMGPSNPVKLNLAKYYKYMFVDENDIILSCNEDSVKIIDSDQFITGAEETDVKNKKKQDEVQKFILQIHDNDEDKLKHDHVENDGAKKEASFSLERTAKDTHIVTKVDDPEKRKIKIDDEAVKDDRKINDAKQEDVSKIGIKKDGVNDKTKVDDESNNSSSNPESHSFAQYYKYFFGGENGVRLQDKPNNKDNNKDKKDKLKDKTETSNVEKRRGNDKKDGLSKDLVKEDIIPSVIKDDEKQLNTDTEDSDTECRSCCKKDSTE